MTRKMIYISPSTSASPIAAAAAVASASLHCRWFKQTNLCFQTTAALCGSLATHGKRLQCIIAIFIFLANVRARPRASMSFAARQLCRFFRGRQRLRERQRGGCLGVCRCFRARQRGSCLGICRFFRERQRLSTRRRGRPDQRSGGKMKAAFVVLSK